MACEQALWSEKEQRKEKSEEDVGRGAFSPLLSLFTGYTTVVI